MEFKTICALATPRMNCAIHIIRISGPKAFEIVNNILNLPLNKKGFVISRRIIMDGHKYIDDVLINTFVSPKSYTGEDVVEINCHGGVQVADYILRLLLKFGAEPAERGEFSKRALINKKIDISQAEAINNLVHSKNQISILGSTNALVGNVSQKLRDFQHELFMLIGQIEVNIDYPEFDDVPQITEKDALEATKKLIDKIDQLIINSKRFIPLNEGIRTIIIGEPNAGKSSLLNVLTNTNKAIVSDIEGTTRDIIESSINIDGITLKLFDTAGIRDTNDRLEKMGIDRALELANNVDLILLLRPISKFFVPYNDFENNLINKKNCIIVYTKIDTIEDISKYNFDNNMVGISSINNQIEDLIKKIRSIFEVDEFIESDLNVLQSNRQIGIFENIKHDLENSIISLNNHEPLDLVIYNYEQANMKLAKILGNGNEYDFLDDLFQNFCVGK